MKAWGRLSLQSNKTRMDDDVSSNTLYYVPLDTNEYHQLSVSLASCEAGKLYDVYLATDNGSIWLTTPWSGNTPSVFKWLDGGLWLDTSNQVYIGTIHTIQAGIAKWQTRPVPAAYGCDNELGIFNAYNRLPVTAINRDTTSEWTYASAGLRYANNSSYNRINWVDGLGDVCCEGRYDVSASGTTTTAAAATVGVGLNQHNYPINWDGFLTQAAFNSTAVGMPLYGKNWTRGVLGRNHWQAMEQTTDIPVLFYGNNFACLTATLCL